jgi:hypothetical protein
MTSIISLHYALGNRPFIYLRLIQLNNQPIKNQKTFDLKEMEKPTHSQLKNHKTFELEGNGKPTQKPQNLLSGRNMENKPVGGTFPKQTT